MDKLELILWIFLQDQINAGMYYLQFVRQMLEFVKNPLKTYRLDDGGAP